MLAALDGVDGVIVVVILLVLVFGGAAIPKFARNLGSAKTEFEKGLKSGKTANPDAGAPADTPTPAPPSDTERPGWPTPPSTGE